MTPRTSGASLAIVAAEREITAPVDLCLPDGHLNPDAVGWSRQPMHRANLRGLGRGKRWEYWAVMGPRSVLAVTVSDLDYAGLYAVWFLDPDGQEHSATALAPIPRLTMPDRAGAGPVKVTAKDLSISIQPSADGVRLEASTKDLRASASIRRPPGHESMGVVVPWSRSRFQYTVKENTLPAEGTVTLGTRTFDLGPDAWATWDFGRGKWPYRITWNWASASGRTDGRTVGLQFGGEWTDGTGSTENAIMVDGRTHKISEDVLWRYDRSDWAAPWTLTTPDTRVELVFRPFHVRSDRTELGLISNDTHQCFGTFTGRVRLADGTSIAIDGLRGWAEEVRNRW